MPMYFFQEETGTVIGRDNIIVLQIKITSEAAHNKSHSVCNKVPNTEGNILAFIRFLQLALLQRSLFFFFFQIKIMGQSPYGRLCCRIFLSMAYEVSQ